MQMREGSAKKSGGLFRPSGPSLMSDQATDGKRDIRVHPARLRNHLGSAIFFTIQGKDVDISQVFEYYINIEH